MYWYNWAKFDLGSTKMGAIIMMATIKYEGRTLCLCICVCVCVLSKSDGAQYIAID